MKNEFKAHEGIWQNGEKKLNGRMPSHNRILLESTKKISSQSADSLNRRFWGPRVEIRTSRKKNDRLQIWKPPTLRVFEIYLKKPQILQSFSWFAILGRWIAEFSNAARASNFEVFFSD